ncbi:hypothetical protein MO973_39215 [Paenibacillus sp. TRM 82003]|nr:hypothetical protein [Paenibacillus sp. TRM 82003]
MKAANKLDAKRFIRAERSRVLQNYETGAICKDQAVGSLNTLYQIASYSEDREGMRELWTLIHSIRNAGLVPQSRFHTTNVYEMV